MIQNRFLITRPPLPDASDTKFWDAFRKYVDGLKAEGAFKLTAGDREFWKYEYTRPRDYPVIDELNAWAAFHGIDEELALLLCANAAAHLAGPDLRFCDRALSGAGQILTLVGAEEDTGLRHAIAVASESLLTIEQGFLKKAAEGTEGGRDLGLDDHDWATWTLKEERRLNGQEPSQDFSPEASDVPSVPSGDHFILQGGIPAKPHKALPGYHKCMAYAPGVIERLPDATSRRNARVRLLNQVVSVVRVPCEDEDADDKRLKIPGELGGMPRRAINGSIRGILLFKTEDLEWLSKHGLCFMIQILPTGSLNQERATDERAAGYEKLGELAKRFDYARRQVLRNSLNARLNDSFCPSRFSEKEAEEAYLKELETYRAEIRGCSHVLPVLKNLPDLLVWYLLQFERYHDTLAQELAAVRHVFAVARKLRQRAMALYNDCEAGNQARAKLELATKLVTRLRKLGRPSTRRELVRGLNHQRMEVVAPVIDTLLATGVFSDDSGRLSLGIESSGQELRMQDFVEPGRAKGEPVAHSWFWPVMRPGKSGGESEKTEPPTPCDAHEDPHEDPHD